MNRLYVLAETRGKDFQTYSAFMASMIGAVQFYAVQSYINSFGRRDQKQYLEKRLSQELQKYEKDKLAAFKKFENLGVDAANKGQYTAAINAEFRKGQMAGFFVDKREVKHIGLEGMSREKLEERLSELEKKIGEAKDIINVTPKALN